MSRVLRALHIKKRRKKQQPDEPWSPPLWYKLLFQIQEDDVKAFSKSLTKNSLTGARLDREFWTTDETNDPDDDERPNSLLQEAVRTDAAGCLRLLLDKGASPVLPDGMHFAEAVSVNGHFNLVNTAADYLRTKHGNVNQSLGEDGRLLIHTTAALSGKVDMLEQLLSLGCDPTNQDSMGCTALHCAAAAGRLNAVKLLTSKYPSIVAVKDSTGKTAAMLADESGHSDIHRLLQELAPVNTATGDGQEQQQYEREVALQTTESSSAKQLVATADADAQDNPTPSSAEGEVRQAQATAASSSTDPSSQNLPETSGEAGVVTKNTGAKSPEIRRESAAPAPDSSSSSSSKPTTKGQTGEPAYPQLLHDQDSANNASTAEQTAHADTTTEPTLRSTIDNVASQEKESKLRRRSSIMFESLTKDNQSTLDIRNEELPGVDTELTINASTVDTADINDEPVQIQQHASQQHAEASQPSDTAPKSKLPAPAIAPPVNDQKPMTALDEQRQPQQQKQQQQRLPVLELSGVTEHSSTTDEASDHAKDSKPSQSTEPNPAKGARRREASENARTASSASRSQSGVRSEGRDKLFPRSSSAETQIQREQRAQSTLEKKREEISRRASMASSQLPRPRNTFSSPPTTARRQSTTARAQTVAGANLRHRSRTVGTADSSSRKSRESLFSKTVLEDKLQKARSEVQALKRQLSVSEARRAQLEKELEEMRDLAEFEKMETKAVSSDEQIEQLHKEVEMERNSRLRLEEQVAELKAQLSEALSRAPQEDSTETANDTTLSSTAEDDEQML